MAGGGDRAGPGPLEVIAAEPACNVDDLADEMEAGDDFRFEGASVELGGVNAAGCNLGFAVAFGTGGGEGPGVEVLLEGCKACVGEADVVPAECEPALGDALREGDFERGVEGVEVAGGLAGENRREDFAARGEVERDGFAGTPVGGDLQDGRTAEAAMSDEELFTKRGSLAACGFRMRGGDGFGGGAGEVAPVLGVLGVEDQRDEGGAGLDDGVAELPGELVAEGRGAEAGDGEAASSDDELCAGVCAAAGLEDEFAGGLSDGSDVGGAERGDVGFGALLFKHVDDVTSGGVAEELAEGFFVEGDAVFFDEGDEVAGCVAGEGGLGEVRVVAEEVFGAGAEVGEVAAAAAGDEDLAAGLFAVVEQEDAPVVAAGLGGGEEASSAGAEDDGVVSHLLQGTWRKDAEGGVAASRVVDHDAKAYPRSYKAPHLVSPDAWSA
jgi:hypothetical protein